MMRVQVLLNLGRHLPRFLEGELHEVDDSLGKMLVENHWAIELPPIVQPEPVVEEPPPKDRFEEMRDELGHVKRSERLIIEEEPLPILEGELHEVDDSLGKMLVDVKRSELPKPISKPFKRPRTP